jgi:hypothetical protein
MQRRTIFLLGLAAILVLAVAVAANAGHSPGKGKGKAIGQRQLISGSSLLAGLASNALYPFLDSTPNTIVRTHIAVTDATTTCSAGAAPPANIQVLVGQAGVALASVMTAATNTGIGTPAQCVFHVTALPGAGGVPAVITDVVVKNAGGAPLTGINTVTASATVRTAH